MNHNNVTPVLCICNESILDAETFSKFDRCGHLLQLMEVVIVYILYLTMEFPGPTSCWCHHFHPCQGHYWSTLCMLVCITAAGSGNYIWMQSRMCLLSCVKLSACALTCLFVVLSITFVDQSTRFLVCRWQPKDTSWGARINEYSYGPSELWVFSIHK